VAPLDEATLVRIVPFVAFDGMASGSAWFGAAADRPRD
jgi:hypothetical protein